MTTDTVKGGSDLIASHRVWFIALGVALVIAGLFVLAHPFAGGLAIELWAAVAFLVAGVAQSIHAFAIRSWSAFLLDLLVGLLYIATAAILWLDPIRGVVALTVFLAAVLVIDGALRAVMAYQIRPHHGWVWLLIGGIVGIIAGVMIWQRLPFSAAWVMGTLLGINLVISGITFIMLPSGRAPVQ
jgi:uncharacterized membrane protein HdeD (DUF308 family)